MLFEINFFLNITIQFLPLVDFAPLLELCFFNLLNKYGIRIIEKLSFPDHYKYTNLDIENITNLAKNKNLRIITTEKDFYRLQYLGFRKFDYLKIQVDLIEEKNFKTEVKKFLE